MDNEIISKVFRYLGLGLIVTFLIAYFVSMNEFLLGLLFGTGVYIFIFILQIICTIWLSAGIRRMSSNTALMLYLGYSALTGLTFSTVFVLFDISSVCYVFFATSIIFLVFSYVGKNLDMDLTKIGIYALIGLLSIIVLEVINMFLMNNTLDIAICVLAIMIFVFYISYDIKRIELYSVDDENMAIFGAFNLYLDFINIFIRLLRLFGKRRD